MLSIERRRMAKVSIAAWLLAIAASPHLAFPQLTPDPDGRPSEQRLVATIAAAQSEDGPYSSALVDPLSALAEIYESSGDRGLARAAIDRALQVIRANEGLFSLDQVPLLWDSIRAHEAEGDAAAAWGVDHRLLALARRNPDDLRSVDVFRGIGNRRMALLRRYVAGEHPPEIELGCYYAPGDTSGDLRKVPPGYRTNCKAGSRSVVIQSIATDAWSDYLAAIRVLVRHRMYSSQELRQLERVLIESGYDYRSYALGRESYERLIAYDTANGAPWLDTVETTVEMADWELLFGNFATAGRLYEQSYALLEKNDAPPETVRRLFPREDAVVLPVFEPSPLASHAPTDVEAHIDATFEVDQLGSALRVRIRDATNVDRDAEKDLLHLIQRSRFRPMIRDGRVELKAPAALRYYVDAAAPQQVARGTPGP